MNDQYVCIVNANWTFKGKKHAGPELNEIVTFDGIYPGHSDWIFLKEYQPKCPLGDRLGFPAKCFAIVISDTELYKELESINKTVEV